MTHLHAAIEHVRAALQPGLSRRLREAAQRSEEADRLLQREIERAAVEAWVRLADAADRDEDER